MINWNGKLLDAATSGDLEQVKLALRNGADVHACHDDALRSAAYSGHLEVVKLLLQNGADVHALDYGTLRLEAINDRIHITNYLQTYIAVKETKLGKYL